VKGDSTREQHPAGQTPQLSEMRLHATDSAASDFLQKSKDTQRRSLMRTPFTEPIEAAKLTGLLSFGVCRRSCCAQIQFRRLT
jgi:hypothetical protein